MKYHKMFSYGSNTPRPGKMQVKNAQTISLNDLSLIPAKTQWIQTLQISPVTHVSYFAVFSRT